MWSRPRKPSAIAEALRDRDLARLHWPVALRPAFDALFEIDDALAGVVTRATEPALAAIKFAWWREQLERLDSAPPPAEPRLRAVAAELLRRGVTGRELAQLEDGWAAMLDERPDTDRVAARGEHLFGLAARLLGTSHSGLGEAGRLYALADVARRGLHDFRAAAAVLPVTRFPPKLRPLTGLAALARRDIARGPGEAEATPGRAWTLIRHRITGRT